MDYEFKNVFLVKTTLAFHKTFFVDAEDLAQASTKAQAVTKDLDEKAEVLSVSALEPQIARVQ